MSALKSMETRFKELMKTLDSQRDDDLFKPRRGSDWEEFKASKQFIDVMVAFGWPMGEGDPYRFLKDHRQGDFFNTNI